MLCLQQSFDAWVLSANATGLRTLIRDAPDVRFGRSHPADGGFAELPAKQRLPNLVYARCPTSIVLYSCFCLAAITGRKDIALNASFANFQKVRACSRSRTSGSILVDDSQEKINIPRDRLVGRTPPEYKMSADQARHQHSSVAHSLS